MYDYPRTGDTLSKFVKSSRNKISRYFGSFNFLGAVLGLVFVDLSFLPSLLPRGWFLQAVLSAVLFCFGYAIGVILSHLVRQFKPREPKKNEKHWVKIYTFSLLALSLFFFLLLGAHWQRHVRELVGQSPDSNFSVIGAAIITILLIMFILLVSRSIRSLYHLVVRLINKWLPKPVSYTLGLILTVVIVVGLINGFLISGVLGVVNEAFSVKNGTTDAGIVQPTSPSLSGSSQSLIPWDTLGRQGRKFIGLAKTPQQLAQFNGTTAQQPIRIYAGLESADNTQDRANLAMQDLKRAGGYQRKLIVVVTTTGTGWVDEEGVVPIEYMYNGDSAVVSMQYSYLPSALSFLVDQQKAKDAGRELYNAVYEESLKLPANERPKIVVFGESLGTFGGETAFADESAFKATSNGAVWAGPPNFNTLWRRATNGRDTGSPEILPVYQNGDTVRFSARPADFNNPKTTWESPKVAYLQNPSDPIVWWSPKLLFEKPDWLSEPRGADVSSSTTWLPLITFWEVSGDMVFSTGVPDGHGHKYGKLPTDAWAYVAPPAGWTQQKTNDLKAELSK